MVFAGTGRGRIFLVVGFAAAVILVIAPFGLLVFLLGFLVYLIRFVRLFLGFTIPVLQQQTSVLFLPVLLVVFALLVHPSLVPVFVVIKSDKKGPNHEQIHQLSCRHTSARWQGNL